MNNIFVLGAGPSGMSASYALDKARIRHIVVEKDSRVGGLCKTYKFGDFITDNGPHRFFSKNQELYDLIKELIGKRWIKVNRQTRFFIDGKFYQYPAKLFDVLSKINLFRAAGFVIDYGIAKIKYYKKEPRNFEEHALANFGKGLANFNVLNYTEKIWGIPPSQLSIDWADQRIKGLDVRSLVKKMIMKGDSPKTLVEQFYYPDEGTGLIYEAMKNKVQKRNKIMLKTFPLKIKHDNKKISKIKLNSGKEYGVKKLISSIPVHEFLKLLSPAPPKEVIEAIGKLKYRSQVYLFITLNKERLTKDQWLYFPNKEIPFGRISEMKNFSAKMSPKDKTSFFIEFFCWEGDEIWNKPKEELFDMTMVWLEKLGLAKKSEVIDVYHIKQKYVYPVYELGYKKYKDIVYDYLNKFSNLILVGRPGLYKYNNQDHSIEMGLMAAKSVIDNKKYDVEKVGSEKEYFEKGKIR